MVNFLDSKAENAFRRFVNVELAEKYQQYIEVSDAEIVKGELYGDEIVEAIKVRFFPEDAKVENIDSHIVSDIHEYCYENKISLSRQPAVERDVWTGKIRYNLVYTEC